MEGEEGSLEGGDIREEEEREGSKRRSKEVAMEISSCQGWQKESLTLHISRWFLLLNRPRFNLGHSRSYGGTPNQ
jgi:hypothetical protein